MRAAKQRSYAAVCDVQTALQSALDQLFYAMDQLALLYGIGESGDWEVSYLWQDSILTDEQTARQIDRDDALNGFIPKWQYNTIWRGMSQQEASSELPDPFGFEQGGEG